MLKIYVVLSILVYVVETKLNNVDEILKILSKNSINESFKYLVPNKIFQRNLLIVDGLSGGLSIQEKDLLFKKLGLRDKKAEKLLEEIFKPVPVKKTFSSHNISKIYSNSSTDSHLTFFNIDEIANVQEKNSNFKVINSKDLQIKSVFEKSTANDENIAKYQIPPFLIRANPDKRLNSPQLDVKSPHLLARIRSRDKQLPDDDLINNYYKNKVNNKVKGQKYETNNLLQLLKNNQKEALNRIDIIRDKFKTGKGVKNKDRRKQLFHAPPEIILEKSPEISNNKIYNSAAQSPTINNKLNDGVENKKNKFDITTSKDKVYTEENQFETLGESVTQFSNDAPSEISNDGQQMEVENIELGTIASSLVNAAGNLGSEIVSPLSNATEILTNMSGAITSNASTLLTNAASLGNETLSPLKNVTEAITNTAGGLASNATEVVANLTNSLLAESSTLGGVIATTDVPSNLSVGGTNENIFLLTSTAGTNLATEVPGMNDSVIMESTTVLMVEAGSNISLTTLANILNENITTTSIVSTIPGVLESSTLPVSVNGTPTLVPPISALTTMSGAVNSTIFPDTSNVTVGSILSTTEVGGTTIVGESLGTSMGVGGTTVVGEGSSTIAGEVLSTTVAMELTSNVGSMLNTTVGTGTTVSGGVSNSTMVSGTTIIGGVPSTTMGLGTTMMPGTTISGGAVSTTMEMGTTLLPGTTAIGGVATTTLLPGTTAIEGVGSTTLLPGTTTIGGAATTTLLPGTTAIGVASTTMGLGTTMVPPTTSIGLETTSGIAESISSTSKALTTSVSGALSTTMGTGTTSVSGISSTTNSGGIISTTLPTGTTIIPSLTTSLFGSTLLSTLSSMTTTVSTPTSSAACYDAAVGCDQHITFCSHPALGPYFKSMCSLTCGSCTIPSGITCYDTFKDCAISKALGYCTYYPVTIEHRKKYCQSTCGLC
uniref:ShKT domain-containing protein n=1 Tax=Parastrongyloides trichosuri TaxID=131310 RepID=A0A0N5A2Y5_PARTI